MKNSTRKIIYIIILCILIGVIPIILNCLISKSDYEIANNETWLLFWATWLGSILGSCITFLALKKTLEFEREKENDSRRLQVKPYLKFTIEKDKKINFEENKDNHVNYLLTPENFKTDNGQFAIDIEKLLVIENLGINSAIELHILEVNYGGIKDISYREFPILQVREKLAVKVSVVVPHEEKIEKETGKPKSNHIPIEIKIAYNDLVESYYEQTLYLTCSWQCGYAVQDNGTISDVKYYYDMYVEEVSKPIFYKDKKMEIEKVKELNNFFKKDKGKILYISN